MRQTAAVDGLHRLPLVQLIRPLDTAIFSFRWDVDPSSEPKNPLEGAAAVAEAVAEGKDAGTSAPSAERKDRKKQHKRSEPLPAAAAADSDAKCASDVAERAPAVLDLDAVENVDILYGAGPLGTWANPYRAEGWSGVVSEDCADVCHFNNISDRAALFRHLRSNQQSGKDLISVLRELGSSYLEAEDTLVSNNFMFLGDASIMSQLVRLRACSFDDFITLFTSGVYSNLAVRVFKEITADFKVDRWTKTEIPDYFYALEEGAEEPSALKIRPFLLETCKSSENIALRETVLDLMCRHANVKEGADDDNTTDDKERRKKAAKLDGEKEWAEIVLGALRNESESNYCKVVLLRNLHNWPRIYLLRSNVIDLLQSLAHEHEDYLVKKWSSIQIVNLLIFWKNDEHRQSAWWGRTCGKAELGEVKKYLLAFVDTRGFNKFFSHATFPCYRAVSRLMEECAVFGGYKAAGGQPKDFSRSGRYGDDEAYAGLYNFVSPVVDYIISSASSAEIYKLLMHAIPDSGIPSGLCSCFIYMLRAHTVSADTLVSVGLVEMILESVQSNVARFDSLSRSTDGYDPLDELERNVSVLAELLSMLVFPEAGADRLKKICSTSSFWELFCKMWSFFENRFTAACEEQMIKYSMSGFTMGNHLSMKHSCIDGDYFGMLAVIMLRLDGAIEFLQEKVSVSSDNELELLKSLVAQMFSTISVYNVGSEDQRSNAVTHVIGPRVFPSFVDLAVQVILRTEDGFCGLCPFRYVENYMKMDEKSRAQLLRLAVFLKADSMKTDWDKPWSFRREVEAATETVWCDENATPHFWGNGKYREVEDAGEKAAKLFYDRCELPWIKTSAFCDRPVLSRADCKALTRAPQRRHGSMSSGIAGDSSPILYHGEYDKAVHLVNGVTFDSNYELSENIWYTGSISTFMKWIVGIKDNADADADADADESDAVPEEEFRSKLIDESDDVQEEEFRSKLIADIVDIYMRELQSVRVCADGSLPTNIGLTRETLLAGVAFHILGQGGDDDVFLYFQDAELVDLTVEMLAHNDSTIPERKYCAEVLYLMAACPAISESVLASATKNEQAMTNLFALQDMSVENFDIEACLVSRYTISKLEAFGMYEEKIAQLAGALEKGKLKEKEQALRDILALVSADIPVTVTSTCDDGYEISTTEPGGVVRDCASMEQSLGKLLATGTKIAKKYAAEVMAAVLNGRVMEEEDYGEEY